MSLPRVSLLLAALGSGGFGIAFLVTPEKLIRQVDLALVGPGGLSEIWAMYGGLELGLAGFFIACAVRQRWARAGLAAQFLSFGGLATGRLAGILQHGPGGRLMLLPSSRVRLLCCVAASQHIPRGRLAHSLRHAGWAWEIDQ